MSLRSLRETGATLRESREAIREGRVAIAEASAELRARYNRALRRIDDVDRALDLLEADGPDTDIRQLFPLLDTDDESSRREIGDTTVADGPITPRR